MMARFRRMAAPIQSDKHEITWSNLLQDAATAKITVPISTVVQPGNKNTATEIGVGAMIKWIYFEFHFSAAQTGNANVIHWTIEYTRGGQTIANPNTYYQSDRSQILKRGMEMLPTNVSTVFKRIFVVKIPKTAQRQRNNQEINFNYQASSTQQINACGIAIYKEIY